MKSSHRTAPFWLFVAALALSSAASAATSIFNVTSFANPASSLTYYGGFSGTVGTTGTWPAEMGWQGDTIDIAFPLVFSAPASAKSYRFRVVANYRFTQAFHVTISAGSAPGGLTPYHTEFVDSGRVIEATIPVSAFIPGQTNYIRLKGTGVLVGAGQPPGIQWSRWQLIRTDVAGDRDTILLDQLQRLTDYLLAATQPNGLVRDSLTLSPADAPFHPATPDAAGFALIGLCVSDYFGLAANAESRAQAILSAYAGHTPGVTPTRNQCGHFWHWMNVANGAPAAGWTQEYTTIGSALLVSGALFARDHFITNPTIVAYANELYATTNFDIMIDPALNGRVALATNASCGFQGTLTPWNEYMLVVSLARNEPGATRAPAIASRWIDPSMAPKATYQGNETLTDSAGAFAPAFWVHQAYYFNADFAGNPAFVEYFRRHQRMDQLYSAWIKQQSYRFGLTAGVSPSGYTVDTISNYQGVFSPEAAAAWGDMDALLDFLQDQPPTSDSRFRYGATRVSVSLPGWIPYDAGLVDHTFMMFGIAEALDPNFFKARQPFQADSDFDGRADAYDNCPNRWNVLQLDSDLDGVGDACECATPWADAQRDGDVDLADMAIWQAKPTANGTIFESDYCLDRYPNRIFDATDLSFLTECLDGGGPDTLPVCPN